MIIISIIIISLFLLIITFIYFQSYRVIENYSKLAIYLSILFIYLQIHLKSKSIHSLLVY